MRRSSGGDREEELEILRARERMVRGEEVKLRSRLKVVISSSKSDRIDWTIL